MTTSASSSVPPSDESWRDVPTKVLLGLPWDLLRRPEQRPPPGDWLTWLILAGRGYGKTRTGAEWVRENHGRYRRWIIAGATASDVRDIMVEGESGILAVSGRGPDRPKYEPSKSRLSWPNGSQALLLTADEPDRFRGKQSEAAWADGQANIELVAGGGFVLYLIGGFYSQCRWHRVWRSNDFRRCSRG